MAPHKLIFSGKPHFHHSISNGNGLKSRQRRKKTSTFSRHHLWPSSLTFCRRTINYTTIISYRYCSKTTWFLASFFCNRGRDGAKMIATSKFRHHNIETIDKWMYEYVMVRRQIEENENRSSTRKCKIVVGWWSLNGSSRLNLLMIYGWSWLGKVHSCCLTRDRDGRRDARLDLGRRDPNPERSHLQPMSMRQMVKIFSASVFGETLPNPTDVSPVIVKYTDVI